MYHDVVAVNFSLFISSLLQFPLDTVGERDSSVCVCVCVCVCVTRKRLHKHVHACTCTLHALFAVECRAA